MLDKVYQDRLAKLDKLRALGIDPHGGRYDSAEAVADILKRFQGGAEGQRADAAGRLVLYRTMGNLIFGHVRDQTGQMQIALSRKQLDERQWALAKLLDLGDIVAASGPLMLTKTGEVTIFADKLTLLCKSLLPMPEKWHGLQDVETRYRQRYLDLMSNPQTMQVVRKRVAIIEHFRSVLRGRGFEEVETPILQSLYGGGAARPFTTHHNTLDADLYLRISPELYLKRLLVGGMEKVFEIGRNFRNEGLSTRHNPEFTMLELYQAYADYEVMMDITEELVSTAAGKIAEVFITDFDRLGSFGAILMSPYAVNFKAWDVARNGIREGRLMLAFGDSVIDYTRPWKRRTYDELLKECAGVSMRDVAGCRARARELGIEEANEDDAVVVNQVFEAIVEPGLAKPDSQGVLRPVFVKDYPADICPLTRRKADDPTIALRFECYIAGMEIANAYTELNDPAVQEANFRRQVRGEGDAAAMRVLDEAFLTALRHGMPPAGGLGIGIDRVVMLLTNRQSIRDVILFPMLRPEAGAGE